MPSFINTIGIVYLFSTITDRSELDLQEEIRWQNGYFWIETDKNLQNLIILTKMKINILVIFFSKIK